ncbi:MAG: helix-turn-helix domain-containing protein [Castellaniella sp.]|uniref:AraC family transcriptional regulator n=1 Tax=Castellaniella sp. TaxID=1955812 RepID=UPI003A88D9DD
MESLTHTLSPKTKEAQEKNNFKSWNEFIDRRVLGVKMGNPLTRSYDGNIELYGLGGASIIFAQGEQCNSHRGTDEIANLGKENPRLLLVRTNAPTHSNHGGHDAQLLAGDLILIDSKQTYDWDSSRIDCTIFAMSDAMVREWGFPLKKYAGLRFSQEHGWARILSYYMAGIEAALMKSIRQTPALRAAFTSYLFSLMMRMVLEKPVYTEQSGFPNSRSDGARQHLYHQMMIWIHDNYNDPTATAQSLAEDFEISVRYVHKLFSTYSPEGQSFLKQLQNVRLRHVLERFRNEQDMRFTVAEIAWDCGFSDEGSLARLFKKRYGSPPGAYRKHLYR